MTARQRAAVETAAQRVLSVRAEFLAPGARLSPAAARGQSNPRPKISQRPSPSEAAAGHRPALPAKTATLADLYDPLAMPPALVQAHAALDRAVDLCYRPQPFESERHRVEFLFALYEKITAPLIAAAGKKSRKR